MVGIAIVGHLVVVDEQQIPGRHGEIVAQLRIIEGGIEGIEGITIERPQRFADPLLARFDPITHVAQGGAIAGLSEDRKAVGLDRGQVVAGARRHQVAVEAALEALQQGGVGLGQLVMHRYHRDQPGATPQRRLADAGQAHPAGMGLQAGAVGVHRGGSMGLGNRNRLLPLGPSQVGDLIERAVGGVQLADAAADRQVELP